MRDIDDIICLLKVTDAEDMPIFAARDLQKLPPVLFDHVDVTRLLKDLVRLRSDVDRIENEYVTVKHLEGLQTDIDILKRASSVCNGNQNVNARRGACLLDHFEFNSGPMGLPPTGVEDCNLNNYSSKSLSVDQSFDNNGMEGSTIINPTISQLPRVVSNGLRVNPTDNESELTTAGEPAMTHLDPASPNANRAIHTAGKIDRESQPCRVNDKSFATIAREGEWKAEEASEEWITIQRKKLRNRFVGNKGIATVDPNSNFKAADIKVPIYIYNVSKEATEAEILRFIKSKINVTVSLQKMNMKKMKDYDAYKVFVPKHKADIFLKEDFWPDGVIYRRYVDFSRNNNNKVK
ncbi:uncharacterized protein LOC133516659 [Cydia pomonella]|uniref:uncharacterized protein LOC133516659 n=1 Tax=Cydia pomonella TaxID=82600 RepID=UPI002ADE8A24|nr:uncharacterized protein LOC133516659 [Cydia pomonella]